MKTVNALLLLGWMEKDEAIAYLQEQCWFDPPLTNQQAEELWQKYKHAVDGLPERNPQPPARLPIPKHSKAGVSEFLTKHKGPEVLDVINVDPMGLLVYQFYVVTDISDQYAEKLAASNRQWMKTCFTAERPLVQMQGRFEDGVIKFPLPHGEHMFVLQNGVFGIQQGANFISVCEIEGRLLLKAGYHRTFAFARAVKNELEASDKSLLLALTKTLPGQLEPAFPKQGLRTTVLGVRPPLLSDFFNETLAMAIKLRKRRYEMHIKTDVVPVDDSS